MVTEGALKWSKRESLVSLLAGMQQLNWLLINDPLDEQMNSPTFVVVCLQVKAFEDS